MRSTSTTGNPIPSKRDVRRGDDARPDGGLDALVNNGAYSQPGAVEDLPTEALREQFEANLFGWHER